MNRHHPLLSICLPALGALLAAPSWSATDIDGLQAEIEAKRTEISRLEQRLESQTAAAERQAAELEQLRAKSDGIENRRAETLAALRQAFERVVADPTSDLSDAQQAYREAFDAAAAHREALTAKAQQSSDSEGRVAEIQAAVRVGGDAIASLAAGLAQARANRLHDELNVVAEITLSDSVTCRRDETIGACIERGEDAVRQLARERFAGQILAAVTEADVVARGGDAGIAPTLIDSEVQNSGFRGQGDYFVELTARLSNQTSRAQACKLLGLNEDQCSGQVTQAAVAQTPEPDLPQPAEFEEAPEPAAEVQTAAAADAQYRLTVRSNVYYDEVFINGVAYGSTKLDVVLPAGEYDVEVRKPGHSSYRERVRLSNNRTISATLSESSR